MKAHSWKRPEIDARPPARGAGGAFRTSDGEHDGISITGVPLNAASDAVVAMVRFGYRVADAEIKRGRRLTRRLKGAAERRGVRDPNAIIDYAERLALQAMGLGLELIEGASTDASPLRRLLRAEYLLVGRWLGLTQGSSTSDGNSSAPTRSGVPGQEPPRANDEVSAPSVTSGATTTSISASGPNIAIRHTENSKTRRVVRITHFELDRAMLSSTDLYFHRVDGAAAASATLTRNEERRTYNLEIDTSTFTGQGRWQAAICDEESIQVGWIELRL